MSEIQKQESLDEATRQAIVIGRIVTVNGLMFLAMGIYLILQTGTWQAVGLTISAAVVMLGAWISTYLFQHQRREAGNWILFLSNCIAPAVTGLVVTRIGLLSAPYIIISSFAIIRWVLPAKARKLAMIIASAATLCAITIEISQPYWTLDSQLVLTLGPIFLIFSLLSGVVFIIWQTWVNTRLQNRILILLTGFLAPIMVTFSWYNFQTQRQDLEETLQKKGESVAISGAATIGHLLETAIENGDLTTEQVFDTEYEPYWKFDPESYEFDGDLETLNKYHTAYDTYTDENWQALLDSYLNQDDFIFTIPVDINGYLPTHNTRWSSWDGSPATDRSKRIFNDPVGLKAAQNKERVLVQIYPRPGTGETLLDVSSPIYVYGRHWGAFRVGTLLAENQLFAKSAIQSATLRSILASGALFVAIILSSIVLSRFVLSPITTLTELTQNISAGQLDQRVDIPNRGEVTILANTFNMMLDQIRDSAKLLEERVIDRTTELELANQQVQERAEQLEAIAQIARTIGAIQNLDELLPRVTRMVSQRFGFYHVGIFLIDDDREYAVLRAANSPGGQRMLTRRHRLEIGHTGIVGYVTSSGNPRIALDTGADAVYFDNPDLPDTHSEMALPLTVGKQIIGALDVQSTEPNAFSQEDINIMLTLAGQVSSAIQNATLYAESRAALAQAEDSFRQLTGQTWSNLKRITPLVGYRFDGTRPEPLTQPTNGEQDEAQQDALSVPVQLRNTTIGRLKVKPAAEGYQWTDDEITIIQATAERVALAVENARLLVESQKQAAKEQVIGEISSKISASINVDNILQTTIREMGRILPGAEISIQVEKE